MKLRRDLAALDRRSFDLIVVGAGIHGCCVARDAARRGLSVAIVDRGDFSGETSHNSLKTIHGGIRYIQHLDFGRSLESIREQQVWLRAAPHLVRPLPFLMPTYGHGMRGPLAMFAGLTLFNALHMARGRARAVERARVLGRGACLEMAPSLSDPEITGAAFWSDAQVERADRAALEVLADAARHGAVAANYAEVVAVQREGAQIAGVRVRDGLTGATVEVAGRMVVNAAGPWVSDVLGLGDIGAGRTGAALTRSMNIVTRRPAPDFALAIRSALPSDSRLGKTRRLFFMAPWLDCAMFGTTHAHDDDGPDDPAAQQAEIEAFIADLNEALPALALDLDDVTYCYRGLTPAEEGDGERSRHSRVVDHEAEDGVAGMVSVIGVKWTTARGVAERCVDLVAKKLGKAGHGDTAGARLEAFDDLAREFAGQSPDEMRRICADHVDRTMTVNLSDMLLRRTDDLARGRLSAAEIRLVAQARAARLGWDAAEKARQAASMRQRWMPAPIARIFEGNGLWEA